MKHDRRRAVGGMVTALLLAGAGVVAGCGSREAAQAAPGTAPPPTGQAANVAPAAAPAAPPQTVEGQRYRELMQQNPKVTPYAR